MKKSRRFAQFKSSNFSHAVAHLGMGVFFYFMVSALHAGTGWVSNLLHSFQLSLVWGKVFFLARQFLIPYAGEFPTEEILLFVDYLPLIVVLSVVAANILIWSYEIFFIEPDRALMDDGASLNFLLSHPTPEGNHLQDMLYVCPALDSEQVEMEWIACGLNTTQPAVPASIGSQVPQPTKTSKVSKPIAKK
jgi:hypothetical protein